MRWPGHIPAGGTCNQIAGNIDMLPTFAKLVGTDLPSDRVLDGRDITSLMYDPQSGPVRDTHLYFTSNQTLAAIRQGDWKLFLTDPQKKANGKKNAGKQAPSDAQSSGPQLYNLATDSAETTNVAAQHPEIVSRLQKEAASREAEVKQHQRPAGQLSSSN